MSYFFFHFIYPPALIALVSLGATYGGYVQKKSKPWKPVGIENGLLGVYALLISFSLVIAGNYSSHRNVVIHEESDDLALLFRKSKMYEPRLQKEVKNYLAGFYNIQLSNVNPTPSQSMQLIDAVEKLDKDFDTFLLGYKNQPTANFQEIDELITIIERIGSRYFLLMYSYRETAPRLIINLLVFYSLMLGFMTGYMNKMQGNKVHIIPFIFVVISIIVLNAVYDLDTPADGFIKPDYQDIFDTRAVFDAYYK